MRAGRSLECCKADDAPSWLHTPAATVGASLLANPPTSKAAGKPFASELAPTKMRSPR